MQNTVYKNINTLKELSSQNYLEIKYLLQKLFKL